VTASTGEQPLKSGAVLSGDGRVVADDVKFVGRTDLDEGA